MNEECVFCEIYKKRKGIIYENKYFFAQLDRYPVSPGHAEIIPKRHFASFLNLTKKEWQHLKSIISEVIKIIERTNFEKLYQKFLENPLDKNSEWFCKKMLGHIGIKRKPDGYNIGINEGVAAGRTIHHFHLHIIPRYFGDVKDPRGGIRYIIPEMGNYKTGRK